MDLLLRLGSVNIYYFIISIRLSSLSFVVRYIDHNGFIIQLSEFPIRLSSHSGEQFFLQVVFVQCANERQFLHGAAGKKIKNTSSCVQCVINDNSYKRGGLSTYYQEVRTTKNGKDNEKDGKFFFVDGLRAVRKCAAIPGRSIRQKEKRKTRLLAFIS